eukprot:5067089-Pyramimonas_sp.AAC.1
MLDMRPDLSVNGASCIEVDTVSPSPATPATLIATPERVGRLADLNDLYDYQGHGAGPGTHRNGGKVDGAASLDDRVDGAPVWDRDTGCSSSPVSGGVRTLASSRFRGMDILAQTERGWRCGVRSQNPGG